MAFDQIPMDTIIDNIEKNNLCECLITGVSNFDENSPPSCTKRPFLAKFNWAKCSLHG